MTNRRSPVGGWPIAIIGMVLLLLVYTLRYALIPFLFAGMFGFVLNPVLRWLTPRMGNRRWPGAVAFSILIIGGAGFALYWVGSTAFQDVSHLLGRLPEMIRTGVGSLVGPDGIQVFGTHYSPQQVANKVIDGATNLGNAARVLLAVKIGAGLLAEFFLTMVLIPYFLVSWPRLSAGALWLLPPERRVSVERMLPTLVPMLRRYMVGLMCVVVYTTTVAYIGLGAIFHVRGAALLSVVVGVLELVPVVGPISSMLLIGLASAQHGLWHLLSVMSYALALRLSIDNLVGPFVLGRAATIHPVIVIFGFVVGVILFGIIGLVLAVPTAACIKLILEEYYAEPIAPRSRARSGDLGPTES